jgi:hypothetical protein
MRTTLVVALLLCLVTIGIAAASIAWVDVELYPQGPVPHYVLPE